MSKGGNKMQFAPVGSSDRYRAVGEMYFYAVDPIDSPSVKVRVYYRESRNGRDAYGSIALERTVDGIGLARVLVREFEKLTNEGVCVLTQNRWTQACKNVAERGLVFQGASWRFTAYGQEHDYTITRPSDEQAWSLEVVCVLRDGQRIIKNLGPYEKRSGFASLKLAKRAASLFEQEPDTSLDDCIRRARQEAGVIFRKEGNSIWHGGGANGSFSYRIHRMSDDSAHITIDGPNWHRSDGLDSVKQAKKVLREFDRLLAFSVGTPHDYSWCYQDAHRLVLGGPDECVEVVSLPKEQVDLEFEQRGTMPPYWAMSSLFKYSVRPKAAGVHGTWCLVIFDRKTFKQLVSADDLPSMQIAQEVARRFESFSTCGPGAVDGWAQARYNDAKRLAIQKALADGAAITNAKAAAAARVDEIFHQVDSAMVVWRDEARAQIAVWNGLGYAPDHCGGDLAQAVRAASMRQEKPS